LREPREQAREFCPLWPVIGKTLINRNASDRPSPGLMSRAMWIPFTLTLRILAPLARYIQLWLPQFTPLLVLDTTPSWDEWLSPGINPSGRNVTLSLQTPRPGAERSEHTTTRCFNRPQPPSEQHKSEERGKVNERGGTRNGICWAKSTQEKRRDASPQVERH